MIAVSPAPTFNPRFALAAVLAVTAALIGLYHDTAFAMVGIWARSETFTHAFLVPPISLWLIWEKRHVLARQQAHPSFWLALPLALLGFAWLLGEMAAVNAITQLAFTLMLILAVPCLIGLDAAKQIAFPLGFLLFAVPIGEFVMPTLMNWTAEITVFGLRASGIPVYQEGLHFVIPSGRWSVVEACSGVRYLIASLTVGTLFAYLNYVSLKRRLIFVGVSILVPVIANWVRAYMIVMLGHLSGNELATGADHLIYGWVFFGLVIMIMFAIGSRWREDETDSAAIVRSEVLTDSSTTARLGAAAAVCLAVAAAPHAILLLLTSNTALPSPRLEPQKLVSGAWQRVDEPMANWKPAFKNPSAEVSATLAESQHRVGVYLAYYRQQGYERKLVSSDNMLVRSDDKDWKQVGRATQSVTLDRQAITVRSGRLRGENPGAPTLVVWHWYWINGRLTANDYLGKAWLAYSRLTGQGDDAAAVFVYAIDNQQGGAEAALQAYLASGSAGIAAMLADAKGQH